MLAKNGSMVLGVVFMLAGLVWLLQGLNILPGSVMTGQSFWAWMGLLFLALGAGAFYFGWSKRGPRVP